MKTKTVFHAAFTYVILICFSTQLSAATITVSCSSKGGSGCFLNTSEGNVESSNFNLSAEDCPGIVTDVNVTLELFHDNISDLEILFQHDGESTRIFNQSCGNQNDIIGTFDDQATNSNVCSISSSVDVQPTQALSEHNGSNTEGTWSLVIFDQLTFGLDVGNLNDWSITISCEVPPPLPEISIEEGFIKLHTTNGIAPLDYYCSSPEGYGRMVFDETTDVLYICGSTGWVIK